MATACAGVFVAVASPGGQPHQAAHTIDRPGTGPAIAAAQNHHGQIATVIGAVFILSSKLGRRLCFIVIGGIGRQVLGNIALHHAVHIHLGIALHMHRHAKGLAPGSHLHGAVPGGVRLGHPVRRLARGRCGAAHIAVPVVTGAQRLHQSGTADRGGLPCRYPVSGLVSAGDLQLKAGGVRCRLADLFPELLVQKIYRYRRGIHAHPGGHGRRRADKHRCQQQKRRQQCTTDLFHNLTFRPHFTKSHSGLQERAKGCPVIV